MRRENDERTHGGAQPVDVEPPAHQLGGLGDGAALGECLGGQRDQNGGRAAEIYEECACAGDEQAPRHRAGRVSHFFPNGRGGLIPGEGEAHAGPETQRVEAIGPRRPQIEGRGRSTGHRRVESEAHEDPCDAPDADAADVGQPARHTESHDVGSDAGPQRDEDERRGEHAIFRQAGVVGSQHGQQARCGEEEHRREEEHVVGPEAPAGDEAMRQGRMPAAPTRTLRPARRRDRKARTRRRCGGRETSGPQPARAGFRASRRAPRGP